MIYRITFKENDGSQYTMLFGDSYKKWHTQLFEYVNRCLMDNSTRETQKQTFQEAVDKIVLCESSRSAWMGWGGLKWCPADEFQEELNREGCQRDEPDNPKPRQYSNMVFKKVPTSYVVKFIKRHW